MSARDLGRAIERFGALVHAHAALEPLVRCPRCREVVARLSVEGFCEPCTRLDLSFEASRERQHVKGRV